MYFLLVLGTLFAVEAPISEKYLLSCSAISDLLETFLLLMLKDSGRFNLLFCLPIVSFKFDYVCFILFLFSSSLSR